MFARGESPAAAKAAMILGDLRRGLKPRPFKTGSETSFSVACEEETSLEVETARRQETPLPRVLKSKPGKRAKETSHVGH
jgi:hypothetical protein